MMANDQPTSEKLFITSTISLMVGILLANVVYLCQQRYHIRQIYQVKYSLKIGMAIGNIIKALFSLPLIAVDFVSVFDASKTFCLSKSYHLHFCTVVFSVALILLGLELVLRSRPGVYRILNTSVILNVAISLVPWVIGCVFALPISLSNIDWEYRCYYSSRNYVRVTLILCMIAPVTIALIACFVFICFIVRRAKQENQIVSSCGFDANESMESAEPLKSAEEPEPGAALNVKPAFETSYQGCQSGRTTSQQGLSPTASTTNYEVGNIHDYTFRKEKMIVLWSSVILFLSVFPFPCFSLSYYLVEDYRYLLSDETERIILSVLYALFGVHSFMLPLIWLPIAKL